MGLLDGKAAIVTGSARGIGRATAELFASEGAKVLINDLDADVAEQTASEMEGETAVHAGDLTQEGAADERSGMRLNGRSAIGTGIIRQATANPLTLAQDVRAMLPKLQGDLPPDIHIDVANDNSLFIDRSVRNVYRTIAEAVGLVALVIFVFLRTVRASIIPIVTIPVSLIGTFAMMALAGFTINTLTLLALVLAIGLVVDDAIVVLENIQRRADLGEPPLVAARRGTQQVAFAVIATTAVLVAVFLPVGFMEGNTGRLFRELSVALAAAVAISAFVALTLTPMMSSKLVRPHGTPRGLNAWTQRSLNRIGEGYGRQVGRMVAQPGRRLLGALLLAMGLCVAAIVVLGLRVPSELAPAEDRGRFFVMVDGPEGAGFDYTVGQMQQVEKIVLAEVGEGKPIQRANSRAPRGWGGSEDMHTGQVIVSSRTGTSATCPPTRSSTSCAPSSPSCRACRPAPTCRAAWSAAAGSVTSWSSAAPTTPNWRSGATASCSGWKAIPASRIRTRTTRKRGRRCGSTSTATAPPTWACRCRRSAAPWKR